MPSKDTSGPSVNPEKWEAGDLALALVNGTSSNMVKGRVYEVLDVVYPNGKNWVWKGIDEPYAGLILRGIKFATGATIHGAVICTRCMKITPEEEDAFDRQVIRAYKREKEHA